MALHHHCYNFKLLLTHFKGPRIVMVGCQFLSPPVCRGPFIQPELSRLLVSPAHVVHLGVGDSAKLDASAVGAAHTALLPTEDKKCVRIRNNDSNGMSRH